MKRAKGFTLIEVMLVVAIIGILGAMIVPRLTGKTKKAKEAVAKADVKVNIAMALDLYELDIGEFPATLNSLMEDDTGGEEWDGPYLKSMAKDPWGSDYNYKYPGDHNKYGYDIYSAGADKQPGTKDDITNWTK